MLNSIKIIIVFIRVHLIIFISTVQHATAGKNTTQNTLSAKQKYAVLISQPNHLNAAVNTAETIGKNSTYNRDAFVVMACGKSVEAFIKGSGQTDAVEKGKAAGVTYKICGMSLKQLNIDPATLVNGVEIIPNGLTYMFDIQLEGYKTVEL